MSEIISGEEFIPVLAEAMYYNFHKNEVCAPYPLTRDEYFAHDWEGGDVIDFWEGRARELAKAGSDGPVIAELVGGFAKLGRRYDREVERQRDINAGVYRGMSRNE